MRIPINSPSQRLLRKGALVAETYRAFQSWDSARPLKENLDAVLEGRFGTMAWAAEVGTTLQRRFRDLESAIPLIQLAADRLPVEEWSSCLLLWIGTHEPLFGDFVRDWLYCQFEQGLTRVRSNDVAPYLRTYWKPPRVTSGVLTQYGLIRTSRDLLRMARDFNLLNGDGPVKLLSPLHLSDRCFLYWAHFVADSEGSTSRVPHSDLWRLALMRPLDVEHTLLRLHQFRKLHYQVAGSLIQLTLPCTTHRAFMKSMVA
jgi:hypothetical protein